MNDDSASKSPDHGQLGLWDCISIIVGIVVGVSIFFVPNLVFMSVGDPWSALAVWLFGGILALIGALCYAELATTYPQAGGDYAYLNRAFGSAGGFLFGWAQLTIVMTASIGAMAYVFATYATTYLTDLSPIIGEGNSSLAYAVAAVLVLTIINVVGVRSGKITQLVLTVAKVIGIAAIVTAGFATTRFATGEVTPGEWDFPVSVGIGQNVESGSYFNVNWNLGWQSLAIIIVLYAYGGWNDAAFVAAEVHNRKRNIPIALILAVVAITVIYLLVNAAYLLSLGLEGANATELPAKLMDRAARIHDLAWISEYGGRAIAAIIMISALGAVNGLIFTGARVYATLGNEHSMFSWLGHWKPNTNAPSYALIAQGVLTVGVIVALTTEAGRSGLTQLGIPGNKLDPNSPFESLVSHSAPAFWAFFLLTGLSLFALRDKNPAQTRPFSVPLYPFLPFIFCLMCVYMLYQSINYVGWGACFALVVVLAGIPFYLISRYLVGYKSQTDDTGETQVVDGSGNI